MSDTGDTTEDISENPNIEPIEIQEEMEQSFLEYAMSVIVSRALPDARDGLKPVHRRILWAMYEAGRRPDRGHVKCATVVGDVIGKYHPHGDLAVYDAMVRLGQSFSLRHPLIDPHGNFGSPSDPPAAYRYTECRLTNIAMQMLADIDENTVDLNPNFDGRHDEPAVLPSRFPNLLVNGGQGIAVGMATNIPPHNLGEVIDATQHLLANPDAPIEELMERISGPDFPTGGEVLGKLGIEQAYRTGRGSFKIRGDAEISDDGSQIIVTSFPYQQSVDAIAIKAAEAIRGDRLDGISDIRNLSAQGQTKLVFDLKRNGPPANVVLNNLYKHTPLQISYSVNMVALDDGVPRTLSLREALVAYVDHQIDVITRRSEFRLDKAKRRAHIVEGLVRALDMIDEIVAAIRASADREEAREALMGMEFSYEQAEHILDLPLVRLTRLGRSNLEEELEELRATIESLEAILADDAVLRGVIRDELAEVRDTFANDRITKISMDPGEFDIEDLIEDEDLVFTMSTAGYVKTVSTTEFRTQSRGGRGVAGANLKEEDSVVNMIYTTAHAYLLFFSNRGKVYRLKAHEVPMASRTARGTALVNLLPLETDETIEAVIDTRDYETNRFLFFATKLGRVKKTRFNAYDSSLKAGLIAIKLNDDDELVEVMPTDGNDHVLLVSRNGQVLRFEEENVRAMGRTAAGVRGMKFREGDELVACSRVVEDKALLIVTNEGFGKRTDVDQIAPKGRAGLGVRGIKLPDGRGHVAGAFMVGEEDQVFLIATDGVVIRIPASEISMQGRDASGVNVMSVSEESLVAAIAPAPTPDEDELAELDELGESDADGAAGEANAEMTTADDDDADADDEADSDDSSDDSSDDASAEDDGDQDG